MWTDDPRLGGPRYGAITSNKAGLFHDGENTIVLDFLPPTRTDGKKDWVTPDMIAIEPLRPKKGTVIVIH